MNDLIAARAGARARRVGGGLLESLQGAAPLDDSRQAKFSRYHADLESALKRNDELAAAVADNAISTLIDEARAARMSNIEQPPAEPEPPVSVDFGGGNRAGRRPVAPLPNRAPMPTSRDLLRDAFRLAEVERIERGQS